MRPAERGVLRAWRALRLLAIAAVVAADLWLTPRATLARWLWGR